MEISDKHGDRSKKLQVHMLNHMQEAERANSKKNESFNLKTCPHQCTSCSKAIYLSDLYKPCPPTRDQVFKY